MADEVPFDRSPSQSRPSSPRWVLWAGMAAILALYLYASRPRASAVPWMTDLAAAQQLAQREGRPVLIDFYATWCGPCETMAREVFPRKEVAGALADWVPVRINGETNPKLMRQFGVEAYPTFVVLSADGAIHRQFSGALPADEFVAFVKDADPRKEKRGS